MSNKVFLGGTCAETTWREDLIVMLKENNISYFNPVVEDWTEECIEIEENEKDNICNIHLYVITKEMKGVYSIAEIMASALTGKNTIFVVIDDGFDEGQIKSLSATAKLARKHCSGDNFLVHFMNKSEGLSVIVDMINHFNESWVSSYVDGILNIGRDL